MSNTCLGVPSGCPMSGPPSVSIHRYLTGFVMAPLSRHIFPFPPLLKSATVLNYCHQEERKAFSCPMIVDHFQFSR
ncbi:hypothetical protein CEXT_478151 [Caerostris extrusa]|uniref:Uncharacterized protein n=1 Tax=Caerostris extrusa TaxID=172846 RepID=A0AAV4XPE2_CAEEX|nr:hypothetical protein CEXT_478151 [Caerostris extrusa]